MRLPRLGAFFAAAALVTARPLAAQDDVGFPRVSRHSISTAPLTDEYVANLLAILDRMTAKHDDSTKWEKASGLHFWRLMNRLQTGPLSQSQREAVVAHFDRMERAHPDARDFLERQREMVRTRMVGLPAPEIIGKDYDGVEFKLSDYRGKVVVVYFTGQWCGPCRGEYPYQRLMLEVHKKDPFAILGVNSDSALAVAKGAKVDNHLDYRSWWDGYLEKNTDGPLAQAWNITGWPGIYIIDAKGVIRFVNLRQEDVLVAVKQLLEEEAAAKRTQSGTDGPA